MIPATSLFCDRCSHMFRSFLLLLCISAVGHSVVLGQAESRLPFPQNRVHDFYATQAERVLKSGTVPADVLPQFPGLDGGVFGHWGQNPEEVSFDKSLNTADMGNVVCQLTHHFGRTTPKAVNVLLDSASGSTVLYDPQQMTFTDAWRGQFVNWGFVRFGLMEGVRAGGEQLWVTGNSRWEFPANTRTRYVGFNRFGSSVLFSVLIDQARLTDSCSFDAGKIVRTLRVHGPLPGGTFLQLNVPADGATVTKDSSGAATVIQVAHNGVTQRIAVSGDSQGAVLVQREKQIGLEFQPGAGVRTIRIQYETLHGNTDSAPFEFSSAVAPQEQDVARGGVGQWVDQVVKTTAVPGESSGPLAIDTITLPSPENNPFKTAMRIGGVGCLSDGRVVVATLMGEVWLVDGLSNVGGSNELQWRRIASGLYRALGLVIQNDQILVLGSDQITRLHDLNGDSEADMYECVTNEFPTTGGHDFCTSLQQDRQGELYWSVSSQDYGVAHRNLAGEMESLGNGLRNSNGIGVSPDGRVVLASVQEGTWTPASAIFEVRDRSYHGLKGPVAGRGRYGYDLPLCFIPRGIDNSSGEIGFLPEDPRLGALSGAAVGTSFGACEAYLVLRDEIEGKSQGAVVPLPGDYLSGVCRVAFNATDGHVYLGGTEGWQSYAQEDGCLQRMRLTGNAFVVPRSFEAWGNGVIVRFSGELDPASVSSSSVFCQQWNYLYSAGYGSPEFSVREPGRQGHDYVPVKSARLLPDGRSVYVEIPQLHPVMQFHFHGTFRTKSGAEIRPDVFATILNLRKDFQEYPEYVAVAKRPAPDFPIAEKYEQDARLVKQEQLGTDFGWVSSSTKLSFGAAPGLQYEPRVLRVQPGARVSLAFRNGDPGMPHNVAIVKADAIDEFGEQSMQLASNPRAIATHYVPEDPREICFSPILQPGETYTLFFEAPKEPGEYRMVCTYPGHWRVMQGSLFVLPEGAALPETAFTPIRSFVRTWTTGDLGDAADGLRGRSIEQGKQVFESAGCIKCHRMKDAGSVVGPELTRISERFRGKKLLQQILEPSVEVNKQYQTWVAVLNDGRLISGLKQEQTDAHVTLLPNPLKPETKVTFPMEEIEELEASMISTMPMNLLITYSAEEILDLVAYLQSGANAEDAVFQREK